MMFKRILATSVASCILLSACAQPRGGLSSEEQAELDGRVEALLEGKPPQLRWQYRALVLDGPGGAVLNNMELGHRAMELGRPDVAASAFDDALAGITAVYADDPAAEKARSVWHAEEVKDFKGEPYERAMAFVYRGILDMLDGDYENARASFKGALIQDSFAELERFRQDFASAAWLIGWTSRCLGDEKAADEAFREAEGLRADLVPPRDDDRYLVLFEAGRGPTKISHGQHQEKIAYREGTAPKASYAVVLGDVSKPAMRAEDLFQQAITRGGRQMDDILADKVQTKTATMAAGQGATAVGAGMMAYGSGYDNSGVAAAGAIIGLIGMIAQAASESMTAKADTRYWGSLPHSLYLATVPMPTQEEDVRLVFEDGALPAVPDAKKPLASINGQCGLAWYSSEDVRLAPMKPRPTSKPSPDAVKASTEAYMGTRADAEKPADTTPPPPSLVGQPKGNCLLHQGGVYYYRNVRPNVCTDLGGVIAGRVSGD